MNGFGLKEKGVRTLVLELCDCADRCDIMSITVQLYTVGLQELVRDFLPGEMVCSGTQYLLREGDIPVIIELIDFCQVFTT